MPVVPYLWHLKCITKIEPKKEGGMRYGRGKEDIGRRIDGWSNGLYCHTSFCKVDQHEGCRDCLMDFYHHRGYNRPPSADTRGDSLLLIHRDFLKHGLQAKERR